MAVIGYTGLDQDDLGQTRVSMAVINLYSFYQAISAGLCLAIQGSSALKQGISCKTIGRVRKTMVCVHRDFFQNTCMQRANQSLEQPQGVVYLPNNPTHPIIARQSPPEHSPAHPSTAHWDNSIGHGGSYMVVIGYTGLDQDDLGQTRAGVSNCHSAGRMRPAKRSVAARDGPPKMIWKKKKKNVFFLFSFSNLNVLYYCRLPLSIVKFRSIAVLERLHSKLQNSAATTLAPPSPLQLLLLATSLVVNWPQL